MPDAPNRLVLASSSPYRRELLTRLQIPFEVMSPGIDESRRAGESPDALTCRLAGEKAAAIAREHPDAWVIGADQVAVCEGAVLCKPGDREKAAAQLLQMQGKPVDFLNGLVLLAPGFEECRCIPFRVHLRPLTPEQIMRYIERDLPFDCAGSFRSEGLGITLASGMDGGDPTALMGLPLIALTEMLGNAGHPLP